MSVHVFKCEVRKKKERSKQGQTNKQGKATRTAHPRQSLFLEKMSMYAVVGKRYIHVHVYTYRIHVHVQCSLWYMYMHVCITVAVFSPG